MMWFQSHCVRLSSLNFTSSDLIKRTQFVDPQLHIASYGGGACCGCMGLFLLTSQTGDVQMRLLLTNLPTKCCSARLWILVSHRWNLPDAFHHCILDFSYSAGLRILRQHVTEELLPSKCLKSDWLWVSFLQSHHVNTSIGWPHAEVMFLLGSIFFCVNASNRMLHAHGGRVVMVWPILGSMMRDFAYISGIYLDALQQRSHNATVLNLVGDQTSII